MSFYGSKHHRNRWFVKIAHTVSNHFIPVYRRILYERWQITKPWSRAESRLNFQLIAHHAVDKIGSFRSFNPSKFDTTRACHRSYLCASNGFLCLPQSKIILIKNACLYVYMKNKFRLYLTSCVCRRYLNRTRQAYPIGQVSYFILVMK